MSMTVGSPSDDPDVLIDINTTPLIDVMLVLLVMLIITIPIQLHSANLNLPSGTPPPTLVKPEIVKVDIDPSSQIFYNGDLADMATVREKFKAIASAEPQPEVHIRPDKSSKYDVVAAVLSEAQRNGVTKMGIVGSEQFIE
ncbi:MAG TPA: biopolymer transporter ExbD [Casimicrobiaceae bacterium]|nr:biopolymer transporter ExbD [Casimicrobiaceae bacterium]